MSKEFLSSLPEVMDHYSQCNLLLPTSTDVQLNPFYKFHVEEVPVDLGENSGDIFKVGSVDSGKKDRSGNTIWVSAFSLTKPMLNKLAMAAGIQFNPKETYGERIDKYTYRAQAQGAMKKADGTARTETDQKVICLEDEEANGLFCNDCGAEINERVYEYSLNKFGRPLCIKCQRGGNK